VADFLKAVVSPKSKMSLHPIWPPRVMRSAPLLDRLASAQPYGQLGATSETPTAKDVSTTRRAHASTETMSLEPFADLGLPSAFGGHAPLLIRRLPKPASRLVVEMIHKA
jgi:hypothetical protein